MRINCAACGERHDSSNEPFVYDIINETSSQKEEVPKFDEESGEIHIATHCFKGSEGKFTCKNCGAENIVTLKWQSMVWKSRKDEEASYEPIG